MSAPDESIPERTIAAMSQSMPGCWSAAPSHCSALPWSEEASAISVVPWLTTRWTAASTSLLSCDPLLKDVSPIPSNQDRTHST